MSEFTTFIALIAGVIILSISFYKFARSDLKDIHPWQSGAVSLTGVALLGFGLFSEITIKLSDEQSITLKREIEQLAENLTGFAEETRKTASQSNQEIQALKTSVMTSIASVEQLEDSISDSVQASFAVSGIEPLTDRLAELEEIKSQIGAVSSSVEEQSSRIAALSSEFFSANRKLETLLSELIDRPQERLPEGVVGIVYFGHNSTVLSRESKESLGAIVEKIQELRPRRVLVAGHADSSGNPDYNLALAERRANTVAEHLMERGVPPDYISVEGLGELDLAVSTGEGTRETLNRRVVISVDKPRVVDTID